MINQAKLGFKYQCEYVNPDGSIGWVEDVANIMPFQGLDHILNVVHRGATAYSTWYFGLYTGLYTPSFSDTAAAFVPAAGETTDYVNATRHAVPFADAVDGVLGVSAPVEVTFTAERTIQGAFIISSQAKGAATGVLISAVRFTSPKSVSSGGILRVSAAQQLFSA